MHGNLIKSEKSYINDAKKKEKKDRYSVKFGSCESIIGKWFAEKVFWFAYSSTSENRSKKGR